MGQRIAAIGLGFLATMGGLALIIAGLLGANGGGTAAGRFLAGTAALPLGLLILELGLAACWLTWQGTRGLPGRVVALPPWWAAALVFALAVGVGWAAIRGEQWWLFYPFAALAVFMPVAATGRLGLPAGGTRPDWRRILPAFAWGALAAPILAILLEVLAASAAIAAAGTGMALSGERSLAILGRTWRHLQGRTLTDGQTTALVQALLRQPLVLAVGAFVLVFAGPVCEELVKFGAPLLFSRARPRRGERDTTLTVFLIGLAAGLGFAATENIFYAAQAGPKGWTALTVMRAATPIMHGTASALFALGWAWQARDPAGWGLLRGAVAALGLHGAWNLCAGLVLVAALYTGAGGPGAVLAALVVLLCISLLGALALGAVAALLRLRNVLGNEANAEGLNAGGMFAGVGARNAEPAALAGVPALPPPAPAVAPVTGEWRARRAE